MPYRTPCPPRPPALPSLVRRFLCYLGLHVWLTLLQRHGSTLGFMSWVETTRRCVHCPARERIYWSSTIDLLGGAPIVEDLTETEELPHDAA